MATQGQVITCRGTFSRSLSHRRNVSMYACVCVCVFLISIAEYMILDLEMKM
jgi:uncharacterized membrane protein YjfL (UPF0719 family)